MGSSARRSARLGALLLGLLHGALHGAGVAPPPAEPVTETVFGRTLTDEYRWMEDAARFPALRDWVLAESEAAQQTLAALPARPAFVSALQQVNGALTRVNAVALANGRVLVVQRTAPGDRVARLLVRDGGRERVLVDPNQATGGSVVAINNVSPSPDGRHVAVHTAAGGAEIGSITIYERASGQPVGAPIGPIWGEFRLSWIDDKTIAYTQMAEPGRHADNLQGMTAYVRPLDGSAAALPLLGSDTQPVAVQPKDFPIIVSRPTSSWVAAMATGARADIDLMLVRRDAIGVQPTPWRRIAGLDQRLRAYGLVGERLFMVSMRDNPYGRVTRRALDRPDAADVVMLDGSERLIVEGIEATPDGVYLQAMTDGRGRLFYSAGGTAPFRELALPFEGSIESFESSSDGRMVAIGLGGWLTNTRYFKAQGGRLQPLGLASDTWPGAARFVARRLMATSRDGTQVPMVAVHARGPLPGGGPPALMKAYGSYGSSMATPFYDRLAMAWVQQGGVMAYCGTRGGGERGRAWHDAGRGAHKPNAHDDLIACAEALKAAGLARAAGPVVMGTSAGGLLVPPAALKRPDLFAGLVARVAIVNPTRLAAAPNGANQFDEMGDPNTAEGWAALATQDAYLMSATAADLPDTLLTIGLNDKRVAPWMSTKLAARVKARFGERRTILLRAETDAGHGVGSAEDARLAEYADIFAFAWSRASR